MMRQFLFPLLLQVLPSRAGTTNRFQMAGRERSAPLPALTRWPARGTPCRDASLLVARTRSSNSCGDGCVRGLGPEPRAGDPGIHGGGIIPPRPPPLQLFRGPLPPPFLPKAAMALSCTPWLPPLQLRCRPGPEGGVSRQGHAGCGRGVGWCVDLCGGTPQTAES